MKTFEKQILGVIYKNLTIELAKNENNINRTVDELSHLNKPKKIKKQRSEHKNDALDDYFRLPYNARLRIGMQSYGNLNDDFIPSKPNAFKFGNY